MSVSSERYEAVVASWGAERQARIKERGQHLSTIDELRKENRRLRRGEMANAPKSTVDSVLHSGYAAWWALIWSVAVVGEIVGLNQDQWLAWLLSFGAVELVAAWRRGRGDTWSEVSWFLQGGKTARGLFASCLGIYIAFRFYSVTTRGPGAAILATGLGLWLVIHFYCSGEQG